MKFYKLTYDMAGIDKLNKKNESFIYAEETNFEHKIET